VLREGLVPSIAGSLEDSELECQRWNRSLLIVLLAMIGFFAATVAAAAYSLAGAAKYAASGGGEGLVLAANFVYHHVAVPWI